MPGVVASPLTKKGRPAASLIEVGCSASGAAQHVVGRRHREASRSVFRRDLGKVAILLDGGYVIARLRRSYGRSPTLADINHLVADLGKPISGAAPRLYRALFYNADPFRGVVTNPISGVTTDFSKTQVARRNEQLMMGIALSRDFALRRGELSFNGWRIGESATRAFKKDPAKTLEARDLVPDIVQKGVDVRIGLDVAALALKRLVDTVILVTGDADMIPAMRLARREGLQVGLCALGFSGIRAELRAAADFVLDWKPRKRPNSLLSWLRA